VSTGPPLGAVRNGLANSGLSPRDLASLTDLPGLSPREIERVYARAASTMLTPSSAAPASPWISWSRIGWNA